MSAAEDPFPIVVQMTFGLGFQGCGITFSTFMVSWSQQRCSCFVANTLRNAIQNPSAPSPMASLGSCFRQRRLRSSSTSRQLFKLFALANLFLVRRRLMA